MSKQIREATSLEIRSVLNEEMQPEKIDVSKGPDGVVLVRVVSQKFEEVDDPRVLVEQTLESRELRLPNATLLFLSAPSDFDSPEELEQAFASRSSEVYAGHPTWAEALLLDPCSPFPKDDREFGAPVAAFWSVKGGVGRTTALCHVATRLSEARLRVLALDLDLDSPGLVATLCGTQNQADLPRFDELVLAASDSSVPDETLKHKIDEAAITPAGGPDFLSILGPAFVDELFLRRLLGHLTPASLYRVPNLGLRRLIRLAIEVLQTHIVILDTRSGYGPESAMSVLDLADHVILFASPAPSTFDSIKPAVEAIEHHRRHTGRPENLDIVAGLMPAGQEARQRIRDGLFDVLQGQMGTILLEGFGHLGCPTLGQDLESADIEIAIVEIGLQARHAACEETTILADAVAAQRGFARRDIPLQKFQSLALRPLLVVTARPYPRSQTRLAVVLPVPVVHCS